MKFVWLLVLLVISPCKVLADIVDIEFHTRSNTTYRTTNLSADLKKNYGIKFDGEKVLLIETPHLSSPQYKVQREQLNRLGHNTEEYQVMFVVACQNEESEGGYYTTIEEARKLANGISVFRVRLLDSKGVVVNESAHPVLVGKLIEWLKK